MSVLDSLSIPVVIAPMAGGPSTPELVNAAAAAETIGFLAGGVMSIEQLRTELEQVSGQFAVNLFRPQEETPAPAALSELATILAAETGAEKPTIPEVDLSNGWSEKFAAVLAAQPAVLSATFGNFSTTEFSALSAAGIEAWVTVTNLNDAIVAAAAGADALVVQGPKAGGHRSTWNLTELPNEQPLEELIVEIAAADVGIPLVAAGGIYSAQDVRKFLDLGAKAVSCGSAFLLADEAGTSVENRQLLQDSSETVSSRAFSGRFARGVATKFTRSNESLPPVYPYLNKMITPLRQAASATGNRDYAYCLVGTGLGSLHTGSVSFLLNKLNPNY